MSDNRSAKARFRRARDSSEGLGLTKDLRPHVELFALDKDAKYRVETSDALGKDKDQERVERARRSETIGTQERFR